MSFRKLGYSGSGYTLCVVIKLGDLVVHAGGMHGLVELVWGMPGEDSRTDSMSFESLKNRGELGMIDGTRAPAVIQLHHAYFGHFGGSSHAHSHCKLDMRV